MNAFANLRARTDERMAVDHRPLVHVSAGIYKHRRHANDARRDVSAVSDRRATWNDAHIVVDLCWTRRISVLVEKSEALIRGHVRDCTHAEAE